MTGNKTSPLLSVERSLGGRRWLLRAGDDQVSLTISQRLGLPDIVCRLLSARGVSPDEVEAFLAPTLRALMPDPSHFKDMDVAAARLADAIVAGETVAVFGDYDVDGATSAAVLVRFFRVLGCEPLLYVPDRVTEGYGPSALAFSRLKERGASVVVTVDCGITAFAAIEAAAGIGLDVVVVDHHEAQVELPPACAVVDPKRLDETGLYKHLAAVGVSFLLVVALSRLLRTRGWYSAEGKDEPDLMQWLDIVALGTVCDVVPLVGLNRAFVAQGLKVMSRRRNVGLNALADVVGLKERPNAYHLGYVLGPRVNAGGRVGQADLGARLLSCDDPAEAGILALRLDEFNRDRQGLEASILLEAIEQAERHAPKEDPLVFVAGDWHPGVIGIAASRLKERYALPCCVIALGGGVAKGSARSVPGIDLGRAVIMAREAGILENGGGHAMAAGFSLKSERLEEFRDFLCEKLRMQMESGVGLVPVLELDGVLDLQAATAGLLETVAQCGPFGVGNDEPRFAIPGVRVGRADVVGQGHVRVFLTGPTGGRLKGIAFKSADSDLGVMLLHSAGAALHVAGTLRLDSWQGRAEAQLVIEDAALA